MVKLMRPVSCRGSQQNNNSYQHSQKQRTEREEAEKPYISPFLMHKESLSLSGNKQVLCCWQSLDNLVPLSTTEMKAQSLPQALQPACSSFTTSLTSCLLLSAPNKNCPNSCLSQFLHSTKGTYSLVVEVLGQYQEGFYINVIYNADIDQRQRAQY